MQGFTGMLRRLQEFVGGGGDENDIPQTDTHWMAESGMYRVLPTCTTFVFRELFSRWLVFVLLW